ncbi:MAG: ABC transporter substrate-binding protein [Bacteroidota bacterium]
MKSIYYLIFLPAVFFIFSCGNNENEKKDSGDVPVEYELPLKYATHFKVFKSGEDFRVEIIGDNKIVQEFVVSYAPQNKNIIKIPFEKIVATSTTHLGFFEILNSRESIVGFPNTKFISDSVLHNLAINGKIAELGTAEALNLEKLFDLNPDIVFDFPNLRAQGQTKELHKVGIKSIFITEFYEENTLGKVEWIKLFGLLMGKEELANKEFEKIEKNYLELKNTIKKKDIKPKVLSGIMFGDAWYAPGGNSFAVKMYENAGASYVWSSDTTSGSKSFSFEKVFEDAIDADYWIGVGGKKSLDDLLSSNTKYSLFKAFKDKNVYSYGGLTPWGANSYFEMGVLRPDVVLKDLTIIFDPKADKENLVYYKKLK